MDHSSKPCNGPFYGSRPRASIRKATLQFPELFVAPRSEKRDCGTEPVGRSTHASRPVMRSMTVRTAGTDQESGDDGEPGGGGEPAGVGRLSWITNLGMDRLVWRGMDAWRHDCWKRESVQGLVARWQAPDCCGRNESILANRKGRR